ncbi:MAG: Gfo/Idh/MocA family oxidoreductase [Chloroflexota bacterium]
MQPSGARIGVVGLGKMGLMHASIFNGLSASQVVAVAEPAAVTRNAFKELNSPVRFYDDAEGMLRAEKLDAVVINTPVATHVPISVSCVRHRVPFFVEKPLAVSVEQAAELGRALRESPTPHMVGFMTRFVEAFRKGKELIASGCLGRLQRVQATIYVSQLFAQGEGWRYDRKVSGGGSCSARVPT